MPLLTIPSPLGNLTLESDGKAITGVRFGENEKLEPQNFATLQLRQCAKELQEYLLEKRSAFTVKSAPEGTDFQKKVWKEISKIPFGQTITYKELAKRAGKPKAIRAAASACGKNPIVIIIPCHRVVTTRTAGRMPALGGYSGGITKKKTLLKHEGFQA